MFSPMAEFVVVYKTSTREGWFIEQTFDSHEEASSYALRQSFENWNAEYALTKRTESGQNIVLPPSKFRYWHGRSIFSPRKIAFRYVVRNEHGDEVFAHNNLLQAAHFALEEGSKVNRNMFVYSMFDEQLQFIAEFAWSRRLTQSVIESRIDHNSAWIDISEEYLMQPEVLADRAEYENVTADITRLNEEIVMLQEILELEQAFEAEEERLAVIKAEAADEGIDWDYNIDPHNVGGWEDYHHEQ